MTTTPATADADFHTEDTTVAERPTAEVTIGELTFQARAPKMKAYEDMASFVVLLSNAENANDKLTASQQLDPSTERELEEALAAVPRYIEIRNQMVAYLRACLPKAERDRLEEVWDDPDSDIDSPHLIQAALDLFVKFKDYFEGRAGNMGFRMPETDPAAANRAVRRAAAKKTATRRKAAG